MAAHRYDAPLSALIGGYKFHRQLHHARLFADLIREVTQREHPLPEILLPVPLHPQRQRYRGYNQALEITRMVGKQLAIPIDHLSLRRHRATAAQSDLDAAARPGNVRGAFSLKKNLDYQHLAIVDDVVTTGNTANEIAKLLKRAGARRVDVWCVARVIC
ncbi:MAG: ComF family protein [Gammaproteobacteria bacterium]|nr:ComF family protein [Gammaproteobacteria bacterium]